MLEASARRRRRRPRRPPNPLFTRWLQEWRDEAAGTRARGTYERALRSLSRYPLPLRSGRAAAVLRHFGPGLCRRLEIRLRQHRAEQGLPPSPPAGGRVPESPLTPPTRHSPRDYRPLPRSGAHALLLTLHKSSEPLPEAELLQQAQPLCDRPLIPTAPEGALGTLLHRDLLHRSGRRPPRCDPEAEFELRPGEFDIVLCADVSEASGRGPAGGRVPALLRGRVRLLLRRLHVGDFLWVAREKDPPPDRPPPGADAGRGGGAESGGGFGEQPDRRALPGTEVPAGSLWAAPARLPAGGTAGGQGAALPPPRPAPGGRQHPGGGRFLRKANGGGPKKRPRIWECWGSSWSVAMGAGCCGRGGGTLPPGAPPEPPGVPCALLPFQRLRSEGGKNQPHGRLQQLPPPPRARDPAQHRQVRPPAEELGSLPQQVPGPALQHPGATAVTVTPRCHPSLSPPPLATTFVTPPRHPPHHPLRCHLSLPPPLISRPLAPTSCHPPHRHPLCHPPPLSLPPLSPPNKVPNPTGSRQLHWEFYWEGGGTW
uniref:Crossover junction endonuclease MUS81 n=1 Tax=Aquila chrysaetos chrysaetos TaxID=223781 RepID=A0A663EJ47_AQUCH